MRLFIRRLLSGFLILVFVISCSSTKGLPPMPKYGIRADYPDLVDHEDTTSSIFEKPEYDYKGINKMFDRFDVYKKALDCKREGHTPSKIKFNYVITRSGKVDAPSILETPSPECSEAVLRALQELHYNKPAQIDGEPVPYVSDNFVVTMYH